MIPYQKRSWFKDNFVYLLKQEIIKRNPLIFTHAVHNFKDFFLKNSTEPVENDLKSFEIDDLFSEIVKSNKNKYNYQEDSDSDGFDLVFLDDNGIYVDKNKFEITEEIANNLSNDWVTISNNYLNKIYQFKISFQYENNIITCNYANMDYKYLRENGYGTFGFIWERLLIVWRIFLNLYPKKKRKFWFNYAVIPPNDKKKGKLVIIDFNQNDYTLIRAVLNQQQRNIITAGKDFREFNGNQNIRYILFVLLSAGGLPKKITYEKVDFNTSLKSRTLENILKQQKIEQINRKKHGPFKKIIGPRVFEIMKYNDKTFLLFGETHSDFITPKIALDINVTTFYCDEYGDKTDTITFERFIFALITENNNSKRFCDIFTEISMSSFISKEIQMNYFNHSTSKTISRLKLMFKNMNCSFLNEHLKQFCAGYPYNRIHFSDYRPKSHYINNYSTLRIIIDFHNKNMEEVLENHFFEKLPINWLSQYRKILLSSENFCDDMLVLLSNILGIYDDLTNKILMIKLLYPSGPSKIAQQYIKMKVDDKTLAEKLFDILNKNNERDNELLVSNLTKSIEINQIKYTSWEMDAAAIMRMFRKFDNDSNLKISYTGLAHTETYKNILTELGATMLYSTSNNDNYVTLDDMGFTFINNLLTSPLEDINCSICSQLNVIANCSYCQEFLCSEKCFKIHKNKKH
jgi:hypothetical protein